MASIPMIDFVTFYVSDLKASLEYFTDVLGFTRVEAEDSPGFHYLRGGAKGIDFGILQASEQTPAPGTAQLYIKVAGVAEQRGAIIAKGVEATPLAQRPFGTIFSVHTPDGYPLTLFEPPASAS